MIRRFSHVTLFRSHHRAVRRRQAERAAGQINTLMGAAHGKKALVVISVGKSTRANGYLERLENELKQAGVEYVVFDKG